MNAWLILTFSICAELFGSVCLKLAGRDGSSWWWIGILVGYLVAFGGLESAVKTLPLGLCYAIWAGVGVVGTSLLGRLLFGEALGTMRVGGLVLIVVGVAVVGLSGKGH